MLDQVTHERIREEAQEIKRRLPNVKQDVDETVLCELLMSLPSEIKNRREHIIGIITGRSYEEDSDEDEHSVNDESQDQVRNDIEEVSISNHSTTTEDSVETINVSDTEDDRDYYYNFSNYDDISVLDMNPVKFEATTDSSSSSGSDTVMDEGKTISSKKIVTKTHVNVDHGSTEIECLEESNNNESLKEYNNDVIYMKSVFYEKNSFSESPKPGCSKDSDDASRSLKEYCSSCNFDDLQIDANRIHTLLPNLDYSLIYKTLCNNQLANNRIELTLWDLLPKERPNPQLASKRKRMLHKIRPLKIRKNSSITRHKQTTLQEIVTDTRTALEKEEQVCATNEIQAVDIELKNRESMSLTNETDEAKMDVTESDYITVTNNTDDNINNPQINMAPEVNVNQLDTPNNDVDTCKDVHNLEKSENYSENKELQSTMNLAAPHKTEVDNIHSISTAMPNIAVSSITTSNIADPSTVASSTAGTSTAGPNTADPSTVGPSIAGPYTAGPSIAGPYTAGPSIAGPSTAGPYIVDPSIAGPYTIGLNIAGPYIADPSIAGPSTASPYIADPYIAGPSTAGLYTTDPSTAGLYTTDPSTAGPYTAGPSIATSSTADPSTAGLKVQTIDALRIAMPILRPAKFTGLKAATSVSSSSSKQSPPILTPPKLQHLTKKNNHAENILNKFKNSAEINSIQMYEEWKYGRKLLEAHGLFYPFVKPVGNVNNTIVSPNKMQSSTKTERAQRFYKDPTSMALRPVPSFAESFNLPKSSASNNSQLIGRVITGNKFLNTLLNSRLENVSAVKSNDEEKSNLRQQDDMNALQVHNTERAEQNLVLPHDKENGNKKEQKGTANNPGRQEIILNEKASKIYYKLIPMFPTVDTFYIKKMCQNYLTDNMMQSNDESALLETLVIFLLENGQKHPNIKEAELPEANNSNITYDLNDQYADLLMIFPEADPIYLRKIAEENYKDPERIKEFVQSKLENPDYPTRAQYLAKKKITEQQKQYTLNFKIQQFLELFPDPFAHFENPNRQCKFNSHAVDFLKHYFSKIRVNTLLNTYSEYLQNLSLTAKALEVLSPDMKTKRTHNMILTEDIPLLQECAFIQHKVELKKYLTELKDQEAKEFKKLKARNELVECQCCYDDECMPLKCSTCENGHLFCNNCIIRSTELILAEGKAHINCLLDCGTEFPLSVLQQVLSPTKFSILLCKRQEAEVMAAGLEGLVSCPFCHFASIPPPEDKVFRCLNPNCMKESCRFCKELNHIPLKCNEVKSDAARIYLEEKMTEALIRKCYKCGRTFFKEEGCNKMTCLCGAQMCYICDQPVTDYRHFQGQGVQNSSLCPLWSDDRRLNAESVIKVCRETMKQIKQKNPEVDINVNALLPKLPPKMKGPHEDVAHANEMPAHAERIARYNP